MFPSLTRDFSDLVTIHPCDFLVIGTGYCYCFQLQKYLDPLPQKMYLLVSLATIIAKFSHFLFDERVCLLIIHALLM